MLNALFRYRLKPTIVCLVLLSMLVVLLTPAGKVHANYTRISGSVGYTANDVLPSQYSLAYFGTQAPRYTDSRSTSIGMDMGSVTRVNRLELWDSDGTNLVEEQDYIIYTAVENVRKFDTSDSTHRDIYTKVTDWKLSYEYVDGRLVHVFEFPGEGIVGRYIKVHTNIALDQSTLLLANPQNDLRAYGGTIETPTSIVETGINVIWTQLGSRKAVKNNDISPLTGGTTAGFSNWGSTAAAGIDVTYRSIGLDLQALKEVDKVEFWGTNPSTRPPLRIDDASDFTIYYSVDGASFTPLTDWSFSIRNEADRIVLAFHFDSTLVTRYIKIRSEFTDSNYTYLTPSISDDTRVFYSTVQQIQPHVLHLPAVAGYTVNDITPASASAAKKKLKRPKNGLHDDFGESQDHQPLGNFGEQARVRWDRGSVSVGVDLGSRKIVNKLEVWNADAKSYSVDDSDYSLYVSDNNHDYRPIINWTVQSAIVDRRVVHIFEFDDVTARYVKVTNNSNRSSFTIDNLQHDVKAYHAEEFVPASVGGVLASQVGYLVDDKVPSQGAMGAFGSVSDFAFDVTRNSIGADLGQAKSFNTIKLFDTDGYSRLRKNDFNLYVSDDNVTYEKLQDWDYYKDGDTFIFYNLSAVGRYVKVHQVYNDPFEGASPFYTVTARGGNLQNMLRVYDEPSDTFTLSGGGEWQYMKTIEVSNTVTSSVYDRSVYLTLSSLDIPSLIAASKVLPGLEDIRFEDANGMELSYYVDQSGIYVRIPEMASSATATIRMIYGNSSARGRSDGAGTFQVEYGTKTMDLSTKNSSEQKPVLLANGKMMLAYTVVDSVYGKKDVLIKFSDDDGQSWGAPNLAANVGDDILGGVVVMDNGDIVMSFMDRWFADSQNMLDPTKSRVDIYVTKSSDNGATWSTPVQVVTGWNYNLTTANLIQLANGDLIMPFHYAYTNDAAFRVSVMYSTDAGATWTKSASDINVGTSGFEQGASEPAIVQLADGSLRILFRQQGDGYNQLGLSVSTDNGRTWSEASNSGVYAPATMPALTKADDNILLFWAGNNTTGGQSYQRTPLSLAYSPDQMQSWRGYRDVSGRTFASIPYGYPAMLQPDFALGGDDSAYFVWWTRFMTTLSNNNWYYMGMRIDDFQRYLYQSHGAYDDFESTDAVKGNYWWAYGGQVYASRLESYKGTSALRMFDAKDNDLAEAMRSFPGMTKGSVQFKLYADYLTSGFSFSLRQAFGEKLDDPGTAFQFTVASDGQVSYTDAEQTSQELNAKLKLNQWHDIELRFDTGTDQCELLINGISLGTIGAMHAQEVISYFNISSIDVNEGGTDVYIDELIVHDESTPLLQAGIVGVEQTFTN